MAGFSHTLPSCLSKLRSSLEAARKQAKRSLEYGYSMEKALLLTDERLYTQIGIEKRLISLNEDRSRITNILETVPNLSKFCTFGSISFAVSNNIRIFTPSK